MQRPVSTKLQLCRGQTIKELLGLGNAKPKKHSKETWLSHVFLRANIPEHAKHDPQRERWVIGHVHRENGRGGRLEQVREVSHITVRQSLCRAVLQKVRQHARVAIEDLL